MTDHLAAQPTPGPYGMERRDGHARFGDRWVITAPNIDRIAVISEAGGAENPEANARLFAASWETAAERDRLRQTVIDAEQRCIELLQERDRLLAALEGLVSDQHTHFTGCSCPWCRARAALAEARKP